MIIWSGLGILIPVVAVIGMIVGSFIGAAIGQPAIGLGLGMVFAALGNWGLWKMIYPKQPKILVDPATGQQVVMNPKHGLFFIPAKAWTWILAFLAVPMMVGGIAASNNEAEQAAKPGYAGFTSADEMISSSSKGITHGNTDGAKEAAAGFGNIMKAMTGIMFTGGSKKNLLTGGDFLTYCQEGPDSIVILCHVPSLRSYKDEDAKNGLADIAWSAACGAAEELDPAKKKTLIVGLRGVTSYGSIQKGKAGDDSVPTTLETGDKSVFFPAFAAVGEVPES